MYIHFIYMINVNVVEFRYKDGRIYFFPPPFNLEIQNLNLKYSKFNWHSTQRMSDEEPK